MLDRKYLLALAITGICLSGPACRSMAAPPAGPGVAHDDKDHDEKDEHDEKKGEHDEHDEDHEHKKDKEIEQSVPMNMVPQAVLDAVKKECPTGQITEAELEAKHGKIYYEFDVKTADAAYDVAISVDGKFISKKVDDDGDDKDDKKPEMPEKK